MKKERKKERKKEKSKEERERGREGVGKNDGQVFQSRFGLVRKLVVRLSRKKWGEKKNYSSKV